MKSNSVLLESSRQSDNMSEVLLSNKRKRKVVFHSGQKYRYDKEHNGTEYYACDE